MTSLTFYGGVNEIGGNKILLEDKDTRIFLDFGMSFSRKEKYFEQYLNPRPANGMVDFLTMGLLPDIPGIYRDDLMKMAGRKEQEPEVDAVLLSHAHADHANYISFLHEHIPIYMGSTCHLILKAIGERSFRNIDTEILDYKPRPSKRPESIDDKPIPRIINEFRTGNKLTIGSLEVEPIHVDHSVPGAYGFIIHTSEGAVVYTGDIRLHGTRPDMTDEFVQRAKEAKPIALISEGTRIADEEKDESERKVFAECKKIVYESDNLVFADFNFKDVDRLRTFYTIAKQTGRKFVVKLNDAYYLKYLSRDPQLDVPNFDDEDIIIFLPKRGSGTYSEDDYYRKDREIVDQDNTKTAEEISKRPDKYLCAMGYYSFTALIDMEIKPGASYIHSASEPYNEEQEISQDRTDAWLEHFGMTKFQSHCSGHARGSDLLNAVSEINAKTVYPVHTQHPDLFRKVSNNIVKIDEGVKYDLN